MVKCEFSTTDISGLIVVQPQIYRDTRGLFQETFRQDIYEKSGINCTFVQCNRSVSVKGTLRGLHYQATHPQAKLVWVAHGLVYDVAVDLRKESLTYGRAFGIELSGDNGFQMFIPEGFAHGFLALSETAVFCYQCSDYYSPDDQQGYRWDSSSLKIQWPIRKYGFNPADLIISPQDRAMPEF